MSFLIFMGLLIFAVKDMNDLDQDDMCDDTMGSDMDDHASETDSKKDGTSNGSKGNSSKPRRLV